MAELKLGVSFDLVYFRQQLQKLGRIAASEFTAPIKISLDRRVVDRELENLQRLFARREYRIKINDSAVEAASLRIDTLQGKVNALRKNLEKVIKIKVKYEEEGGIGPTGATQASGAKTAARRPAFLDSPAYQAELKRVARANAQTLAKAAASLPSGRNRQEAERLLQAFQAQNPQGASRTAALSAIRELIARGRYQQGLGFEARMQPLRGQRGISAPRSMPNLNQMLDRIANLTENPRAAQRMLRMMPEGRLTTDLIGAANRQAAFREQFPGGFRMPGFQGRKAFDPLLKAIAKDFSDYARTVNTSDPWVGKIGDGIRRVIATAVEGRRDPLALPAAGQSSASRMMRSAFSGLPPITAPQIGMENVPLSRAATYMLNKANRALGLPIGPSSPLGSMGQFPMSGMLGRGSMGQFPMDDFLAIGGPSAIGQARAGSTPWLNTLWGSRGYIPSIKSSFRFPMEGMMGPSSPLGTITAQSSMFGGGGGGGSAGGGRGGFGGFGGGGFGRMMGFGPAAPIDFSFFQQSSFPLTGAIRELGEEFGTAVKQVLLFGTAYKALAFITDLPNQALAAATALQTFRNQLEAVTGGSAQAEQAFAFVGDVAAQLNVPLESARAGFVRMFASMEPAGIAKLDIENLFLGISKAAATFGMSTDEVNRMTNAFAQMASKGQLSAEEVKNQLGDVMPGALSLFARAAQMDIGTFLEAMEDGQFKAEAMGQVLRNVGKLMNTEFSGAAAGAANTLQGSLNGLSNAVKLMYESFEPLVALVGAAVFPQLETVITDVTEAVKAFVAGMQGAANPTAELSSNGEAIYNAFGQVVEIGKSLEGILTGELGTALVRVSGLFLSVTEYIARFLNTGLGQWLTRITLQIGLLTTAWGLLARSGIIPATVAMVRFVATLNFAQLRVYIAGIMSMVAAFRSLISIVNVAKVAIIGFKTIVLGAVGAGVLFAIDALVQRFANVGNAIKDVAAEARRAKDELDSLATAGQLGEVQGRKQLIQMELQSVEKAQATLQKLKAGNLQITQSEFETLQRTGLAAGINYRGGIATAGQGQIQANLEAAQRGRVELLNRLGAADEAEAEASRQAQLANRRNQQLEQITLAADEKKGKKGKELKDFAEDEVARLREQLELQKNLIDVQVDLSQSQKDLLKSELEYQIGLDIVEAQYQAAIKTLGEYKQEQRGAAQASMQNAAVIARENVTLEYRKALLGDLAGVTNEYENKIFGLNNDIKALRASQDELTASEVLEQKIRFKTVGYTKEQLALIEPFLNKLRKEASMIDTLTRSYEFLVQAKEKQEALRKLRNEAAQFRAPLGQERLAELMQMPGYTEEEARQRFLLEEQNRRLQVFKQGANDLAGSINSSIGDALTNIATDFENLRQHGLNFIQTLANAFKQLANTIIQEMTRAMINRAVSQLFGFLMPASFGGGAQIGQQVNMPSGVGIGAGGGILQNAGGQGFGTLGPNFGIRQFATGGMVTGPTLGLIGEGRFNEAVVPMPNGKSIPVDLGGAAGSNISTNIVVNMNNGQASSQMTGNGGQALGRELEGAVRSVLLKESRPGGIIYSQR